MRVGVAVGTDRARACASREGAMPSPAVDQPQSPDASQHAWPSDRDLASLREDVAAFAERHGVPADPRDVRVAVAPYRVCPLGAHVDHQGGRVAGMALDCGVLLGFLPAPARESGADRTETETETAVGESEVLLRSDTFAGEVRFDVTRPYGEEMSVENTGSKTGVKNYEIEAAKAGEEREGADRKNASSWGALAVATAEPVAAHAARASKTELQGWAGQELPETTWAGISTNVFPARDEPWRASRPSRVSFRAKFGEIRHKTDRFLLIALFRRVRPCTAARVHDARTDIPRVPAANHRACGCLFDK